jgi:hypothetical protein
VRQICDGYIREMDRYRHGHRLLVEKYPSPNCMLQGHSKIVRSNTNSGAQVIVDSSELAA